MKQDEKHYQGWKNYQTWAVALWIDNDYAMHCYWRKATRECKADAAKVEQVKQGYFSSEEIARLTLAERLKDEVTAGSPIKAASLYADLMSAALQEVNWQEIAEHYLVEE